MEPDSLLDPDDSYGKKAPAPAKWRSWGFKALFSAPCGNPS